MRIQHALTLVGIASALALTAPIKAAPLDNWQVRSILQSPTGSLAAVTYGAGLFVAVGNEFSPARDWIVTSPDGMEWTPHSAGVSSNSLTAVTYGNGVFAALGRKYIGSQRDTGIIVTSTDGVAWVQSASFPTSVLDTVTCGNGVFVALGSQFVSATQRDTAIIVTSTNGTEWAKSASFPSNTLWAVTYGNGVFVAIGYGSIAPGYGIIATSSNGIHWSAQNMPAFPRLISIAFGNGIFAAVTSDRYVLTSSDGLTWAARQHSTLFGSPFGITYGSGLFVVAAKPDFAAVGFFVSSNAEEWTQRGGWVGNFQGDPVHGNGVFVAQGSQHIAWLDANTGSGGTHFFEAAGLRAVAYGRGTFVAVGYDVILQSDPLPTACLIAGPLGETGLPLTITGETGLSYRLQAAAEVPSTNWNDLLTFTNTASATSFLDTEATNFNRRFYRVVSP